MAKWWPKEATPNYHPKTTRQDKIAKLSGYEYTSSGFTTKKGARRAKKLFEKYGLEPNEDPGLI